MPLPFTDEELDLLHELAQADRPEPASGIREVAAELEAALPPAAIERMRRIERIAVDADRRAIALVHKAAQAVVARFAQRSDRARDELIVIAAMRRVMISDRRRGDAAGLEADGA